MPHALCGNIRILAHLCAKTRKTGGIMTTQPPVGIIAGRLRHQAEITRTESQRPTSFDPWQQRSVASALRSVTVYHRLPCLVSQSQVSGFNAEGQLVIAYRWQMVCAAGADIRVGDSLRVFAYGSLLSGTEGGLSVTGVQHLPRSQRITLTTISG